MQVLKHRKSRSDAAATQSRLSDLLANIDKLIMKASETRKEIALRLEFLKSKRQTPISRSDAAIQDLKSELDIAWNELNRVWINHKLRSEKKYENLTVTFVTAAANMFMMNY